MSNKKYTEKIVQNFRKTKMNKIYALVLLGASILSVIPEGDATFLVFGGVLAAGLFFAKENWIM